MPRKTTILIYDGDDMERLADLRREVDIAERYVDNLKTRLEDVASQSPRRLGDDAPPASERVEEAEQKAQEARDAYDAFVDEAAERAEEWEIHAIGHEDFRKLLRDHPPRKVPKEDGEGEVTHSDDEVFDVNTETFPKALLGFVDSDDEDHRTVHEPFGSVGVLQKRLRRLSAGEFDSLWVTAYSLNNGAIGDPKASVFTPGGPRFDET